MTQREFDRWKAKFGLLFLRDVEEAHFLDPWLKARNNEGICLEQFSLTVAEEALSRLCTDPRIADKSHPAAYVRNRLPLILEYLQDHQRSERELAETRERRQQFLSRWQGESKG